MILSKDILGKEIETTYINSSANRVIENLQKQLTTLYLFLDSKGLLDDEAFKDFAGSQELAERIEKMNELQDEHLNLPLCRFVYVVQEEDQTAYYNNDPNSGVGCSHVKTEYIQDQSDGAIFNIYEEPDMRKLVGRINERLEK